MDQSNITDKLMKEPHTPFIIFSYFYSFTYVDEDKVVSAINKFNDVSPLSCWMLMLQSCIIEK